MALSECSVLITGATGFVGGALARSLLAGGVSPDRLRCIVRSPRAAGAVGLPADCLRSGDITRPETLAAAVAGVDLVFHVAGAVKASQGAGFDAVNAQGTRYLMEALRAHAPAARVVLVSSLAAAGPSTDGVGSDLPPDRCRPVSRYGESKRRGEDEVVVSGLPHVIVRPPVVYGPGDAATRLLFRQALAPLCAVPLRPRPLSVIHVRDVVAVLAAAADALLDPRRASTVAGRALPIEGPERTDTHALMRAIAAAHGRRARLLPMPLLLATVGAAACDVASRLLHRAWFFSGDKVRELRAIGWVADARAARELLAWRPRVTLAEGLGEIAGAAAT